MRERINKPRAFLSHARKDVEFIKRVENDLRLCQIEPWRDQNEIRDGEPWQNVIFAEGLPTCDVVITYYTENALESQMVAKEVDAALIRQLADNGIGFLPYVNNDTNRNNLRLDIQSLHCRVWNADNYNEILPTVVAEIWRRYTERILPIAILQEKSKRLELELELKNLQSRMGDSAFTPQEESEFQYFTNKLLEPHSASCVVTIRKPLPDKPSSFGRKYRIAEYHFEIPLIWFLIKCVWNGDSDPSWNIHQFLRDILKEIGDFSFIESKQEWIELDKEYRASFDDSIYTLMEILGLLKRDYSNSGGLELIRGGWGWKFTEKMRRFVYWIDYYQKAVVKPTSVTNFRRNEAFEETME